MHADDPAEFRNQSRRVLEGARGAEPGELTAAIEVLAPVLSGVGGIYSKVAVFAGACVEWGGSPMPLRETLPRRAIVAMQCNALFPAAWQRASDGQPLPEGQSMGAVLDLMTAYAERGGLPARSARWIALSWFDVRDWIKPMIAVLADRAFRTALAEEERREVRDAAAAIAGRVDGAKWLQGLAMVLDEEPLVVLDPASGRGFRLTMSGVGDNFQLHTLLAERLAGSVPGLNPPKPAWVEQATDAPLAPRPSTDLITRRFRLFDGNGAYVYPEGRPADIGKTSGARVLVIHPPYGPYGWTYGRAYKRMLPRLTLDAALDETEAAEWLGRIAPAVENDLMAPRGK